MNKTPYQKPYLTRIEALNDQLWYFLFANEELNSGLSRFSPKVMEYFTTDLFYSNKFSSRIHVKAKDLKTHQAKNQQLTFGAYFSNAYEISINYIRDIFELLKENNSLAIYQWNISDAAESNLLNLFTKNGLTFSPQYILDTLSYLRHRRNHFTHIHTHPNTRLLAYIAAHGAGLATKWKSSGVVSHVDFLSQNNLNNFEVEETIEFFKLLRICIEELDAYIASVMDESAFIHRLVVEQYGDKKARKNSIIVAQRLTAIINLAKKYGISATEAQCAIPVNTIGFKGV